MSILGEINVDMKGDIFPSQIQGVRGFFSLLCETELTGHILSQTDSRLIDEQM